jgi:RNA recognition motif-containing protein
LFVLSNDHFVDDRAASRGGYVGFVESNHHYDMAFNSDSTSITSANRIEVPDTVFVKGIPISAANERDIGYVFGCAGEIVQNDHTGGLKIKIYYDYNTGEPRGDCTIAFIDEETAARAIAMYNGWWLICQVYSGEIRFKANYFLAVLDQCSSMLHAI